MRVFWFSRLFSKPRIFTYTTLFRSRSYLRYGRNGHCFVGFRGRLVIQTWQNIERYRRKGLSGDLAGGTLLTFCYRGTSMADFHSRAPMLGGSGLGHESSFRLFLCASFGFRGFSRNLESLPTRLSSDLEAIFDTDATVIVS